MSKKILEIILNIIILIIVIIAIFVVYNFVQTKILNKEYCNIFGYTIFQVSTGSMSNTIEVDDIVIVKLNKENLKENDIIVFKQDENIITHRIIKKENDKITTKGDANNAEDNPIKQDDVIGKVIKIIPNIAIWKKVLKTPKVIISIIITITLFIISISLKDEKEEQGGNDNGK